MRRPKLSPRPSIDSLWLRFKERPQSGFQESWHLNFYDPLSLHSIWIRFSILVSRNGFKRLAEVRAIVIKRGTPQITATSCSIDLAQFKPLKGQLQIGNPTLSESQSTGTLNSKGHSISWELSYSGSSGYLMTPAHSPRKLSKNRYGTLSGDLLLSGSLTIDGQTLVIKNAPGSLTHWSGNRVPHSWNGCQANSFANERGEPAHLVFEALAVRSRITLGPLRAPQYTSYYFRYRDEEFHFNTLWDSLRNRSATSPNYWNFRVERGELIFTGEIRAEYRNFMGSTIEDTDGSLLFCSTSRHTDVKILVYRRGKIESSFFGTGYAILESVDRQRNPYVPTSI
jgi:hypothetical protein